MGLTPHDRMNRIAALKPPRKRAAGSYTELTRGFMPSVAEGSSRLAQLLGASVQSTRYGEHLSLRRWFSDLPLCEPTVSSLRLLAPGAPEDAAEPRNWLFLDTETTGLAGGTGTYPFMIGLAWWDAGGLEVEQFFMRDLSEEHSVLVALNERLAERQILVTFNGKSFDWPLLETRYRMTRKIKIPSLRAHLDLLHPARHLWRLRLGSVRLIELERHVLGLNRGPDIMSELIPQIYFDFLRGGPPEPLVPIFYHNQMDLVGLAALAGRVFSLLAAPESLSADALELFGVSRICDRRGESARARGLYAQAIEGDLPPRADRAARSALARIAKRDGDFHLATSLWMDLREISRDGIEAYEELAKYYEHRAQEPQRAADLMGEALAGLRRARNAGIFPRALSAKFQSRLGFRLARLRNRLTREASRPLLRPVSVESPDRSTESN
ncbi:MAG: ribonuclease H-like domain-containing protein [Candidatus Acidiferrales bacterium]